MAADGTLRVRIVGDDSDLRDTVRNAGSKLGGFAKKVGKVGAAGAAAAAGGILAATKKTADYGDRVAKTSRQVGLGVEDFQELEFAFGQLGLGADESEAVLTRFNKRVGEAAAGEGAAAKTIEDLGVSLRDANGEFRDQDDILSDAMRQLEGLESSQERAAAAADLFGDRQGPALASAMEAGGDGIDDLRQKARDLGVVMDEDSAEASERFNDSLDDLKQGLMGAVRTAAGDLVPVLADKVVPAITEKVIPAVQDFFEWIGPKLSTIMAGARRIVEKWWPVVVDAFNTVRDVVTQVVDVVRGIIDRFRGGLEDNASTISTWRERAAELFAQFRDTVASAFEAIRTVVETVVNIVTAFWDRFGRHIVDHAVRQFGRIIEIISGAFDVIKGLFDVIIGVLTGDWAKAWDGIKSIVSGAWKIITNLISGAWDLLKTIFGAGVAALSQVWSFLWDQFKQVLKGAWESIVRTIRLQLEGAKAILEGIVDFVAGLPRKIARAARGMWDGIKDAFRAAVNWLIDRWNNLSLTLGGQRVDLPFGMGFNIPSVTLNTPNIPRLEDGGEVLKTGLAVVHRGERFSGTRDQFPIERERPTFNVTQNFYGSDPRMAEDAVIGLRKMQIAAVS